MWLYTPYYVIGPELKCINWEDKTKAKRWTRDSYWKDHLTIIVIVPAGLLNGVTVRDGVGGWGRGQVGCYTAHSHGLAVPVDWVGVEGAKLGVFWDGWALKGVAVQIVARVAGDAGSVGDGAHGDLRRDIGVDVLQLRIKVRPESMWRRVPRPLVVLAVSRFGLAAAHTLSHHHEEQHQEEDACYKHHDAHHLLQANVPWGGNEFVANLCGILTQMPTKAARAVAVEGAVGVLALAVISTRVFYTFIYIAQASGRDRRGGNSTIML